ncbi:MAG: sensor histidine kinase [Nakamurella sp.]
MDFGQFWRTNQRVRDAVLPSALILTGLVPVGGGPDWLTVLLVAPLYWRRTDPEVVFAATLVLACVQLGLYSNPVIGDLAIPVVVYSVAAFAKDRRWGWAALVAGLVGSVIGPAIWFSDGLYQFASLSIHSRVLVPIAVAALAVGLAFLLGRREVAHVGETVASAAERERLLAVDRDQRAEMAAAAERTRIARELHDIVAHSLSVVVVQADGGIAAAKSKPEVASQVLGTIAETARAALADMRRLVGVLRAGADAETDHPDYAPAPTAADVPDLVAQVVGAGQPVELVIAGDVRELPAGVGLTVYRIVQESLTNVIKHAGPAAKVEVTMHYGQDDIQVTVLDDGRGAAAFGDGMGNGLTGMRERVALQGGTVAAHPRAGGGFLVTASIPAPGEDAGGQPTVRMARSNDRARDTPDATNREQPNR